MIGRIPRRVHCLTRNLHEEYGKQRSGSRLLPAAEGPHRHKQSETTIRTSHTAPILWIRLQRKWWKLDTQEPKWLLLPQFELNFWNPLIHHVPVAVVKTSISCSPNSSKRVK